MNQILSIKNMVCDRCINTVKQILVRLEIPFETVSLGEVGITRKITQDEQDQLQKELGQVGFELIADKNESLVSKIKSIIINSIYEEDDFSNKNLSVLLSEQLNLDYSHLSSLFSRIEGRSIQAFQFAVKTERIKELLEYNEKTISEIADILGFGSAAYLSTSFKKATGITPSQYRMQHLSNRKKLDML